VKSLHVNAFFAARVLKSSKMMKFSLFFAITIGQIVMHVIQKSRIPV